MNPSLPDFKQFFKKCSQQTIHLASSTQELSSLERQTSVGQFQGFSHSDAPSPMGWMLQSGGHSYKISSQVPSCLEMTNSIGWTRPSQCQPHAKMAQEPSCSKTSSLIGQTQDNAHKAVVRKFEETTLQNLTCAPTKDKFIASAEMVQVKDENSRCQKPPTLHHFDFVDSDEEELVGGERVNPLTSTTATQSQRRKKSVDRGITTKDGKKDEGEKNLKRNLKNQKVKQEMKKGHEEGAGLCGADVGTVSPMKDSAHSAGTDNVDSSLRPSLLEEVLSEKKLLLMRSPEVIRFIRRHQAQLGSVLPAKACLPNADNLRCDL